MNHVIVVEDDPHNAILFRKILEKRAGCNVTLTEDPGPVAMEELGRKNEAVRSVQPNFAYRGTEGQRQVAP